MAQRLSPELWNYIAQQLSSAEYESLCLTSKFHRSIFADWLLGDSITIEPSQFTFLQSSDRLPYVRHLRFRQGSGQVRDCWTKTNNIFEMNSERDTIKEGQLESFSWETGTCFPNENLKEVGFSKSLQSLHLETDPYCGFCWGTEADLSLCKELQTLSWRGFRVEELHVISTVIDNNSAHLKELKLDPVAWSSFRDNLIKKALTEDIDQPELASSLEKYVSRFSKYGFIFEQANEDEPDNEDESGNEDEPGNEDESGNENEPGNEDESGNEDELVDYGYIDSLLSAYLSHEVFGLQDVLSFPKICTLSLSEMPLSTTMASAFNFETLTSLTLRTCRNLHGFLEYIMKSDSRINLTALEIQFGFQVSEDETRWNSETLLRFLQAFKGLEELYISRVQVINTAQFFQQVGEQHPTLKRLVEHQRLEGTGNDIMEESHDSQNLSMYLEPDFEIAFDSLASLDLDFIGLTCAPKYLKRMLCSNTKDLSFKVLHIRQSSLDIDRYDSESWAIKKVEDSEDVFILRQELYEVEEPFSDTDPGQTTAVAITEYHNQGPDGADNAVEESEAKYGLPLRREFSKFLEWIFGPQGISSLEFVAYGDFSFSCQVQESISNLLFCRDKDRSGGFRLLKEHSLEWKKFRDKYCAALKSCPVGDWPDDTVDE